MLKRAQFQGCQQELLNGYSRKGFTQQCSWTLRVGTVEKVHWSPAKRRTFVWGGQLRLIQIQMVLYTHWSEWSLKCKLLFISRVREGGWAWNLCSFRSASAKFCDGPFLMTGTLEVTECVANTWSTHTSQCIPTLSWPGRSWGPCPGCRRRPTAHSPWSYQSRWHRRPSVGAHDMHEEYRSDPKCSLRMMKI